MENFIGDEYFSEYEDLQIHELMLKDRPRQKAYHDAIMQNANLFKDKIVMDVGAGTGILSAFCAQAGARLVYAVEASALATLAVKIIEDNAMTSVVKVIHSKIEDFELPASAEKPDIIVSEWMGFYLLHEGMLDSVIYARDKFLKPDGIIFPKSAVIYVAPCQLSSHFSNWDNVDGICMRKFAEKLREQKNSKPEITLLEKEDLLNDGVCMHYIDLQTVTSQDLDEITYKEVMVSKKAGRHEGYCIWFECEFPSETYEDIVVLSTAPHAPPTHWKQCVIVLPDKACREVEEMEPIAFELKMKRNPLSKRKYNLEIELLDALQEQHPAYCDCFLTKCILTKAHLQKIKQQMDENDDVDEPQDKEMVEDG